MIASKGILFELDARAADLTDDLGGWRAGAWGVGRVELPVTDQRIEMVRFRMYL